MKKKEKCKIRYILLGAMFAALLLLIVFMRFGGFSTGEAANVDELQEYALPVETLSIPEEKKIIALGEATHGNVEFQRLKLEVFKKLLEERGVRAFALEGDCGGCEAVDRYIHGGEGLRRRLRLRSALPFIERRRWQNSSPICVNTTKTLRRGRMFAFTALICSEFPARFNF